MFWAYSVDSPEMNFQFMNSITVGERPRQNVDVSGRIISEGKCDVTARVHDHTVDLQWNKNENEISWEKMIRGSGYDYCLLVLSSEKNMLFFIFNLNEILIFTTCQPV